MVHLFDTVYDIFEGQGHGSKLTVPGEKEELSNCRDGRPWLKSRPELEYSLNPRPTSVTTVG